MLAGSRDSTVRLWDANSGQCVYVLEGHTYHVQCLDWATDQRRALSSSNDPAALLLLLPSRQTDLEKFWAPVLEPKGPALVCLGQPKAYFFNTAAQAELDRWFAHKTEAGVRPPAFQSVPIEDVVPAWDLDAGNVGNRRPA